MNNANYSLDITDKYQTVSLNSIPESSLGTNWAQITYKLGTEQEETRTYDEFSTINQILLYNIQITENFLTTREKEEFDRGMVKIIEQTHQEMRERNKRETLDLEARRGRRYTI